MPDFYEWGNIKDKAVNKRGFLSFQEKDEGFWTCRAENGVGSDEVVHQIILNRPPSVVSLFLGYVGSTSVQIHWEPPTKADPPVTGKCTTELAKKGVIIHYTVGYDARLPIPVDSFKFIKNPNDSRSKINSFPVKVEPTIEFNIRDQILSFYAKMVIGMEKSVV